MFHIFGILLIIILVILVIGLSIIGTVLRKIFGLGKRRTTSSPYQNGDGYQQTDSSQQETTESSHEEARSKRKKLFSKDDGEYVDFEEVKE